MEDRSDNRHEGTSQPAYIQWMNKKHMSRISVINGVQILTSFFWSAHEIVLTQYMYELFMNI